MAEAHPSTSFDSTRERVGSVYAKALLGATEAQQVTPQVLAELDSLVDDILSNWVRFAQFLASPRIALGEKIRILDVAFASRMNPLLLNFLKVLARHGRLDSLTQIRAAAHKQYSVLCGRLDVSVITATPVDSPLRSQIEQRLTVALGQPVQVRYALDPQLLGGLLVRVGDTVFDGSLDNRLDRMHTETVRRATQLIRAALPRYLASETT